MRFLILNKRSRKTAICNWFAQGLKEYDVMVLAGHSDFRTTHKFYLAVAHNLKERVRQANARGLCQKLVQQVFLACKSG